MDKVSLEFGGGQHRTCTFVWEIGPSGSQHLPLAAEDMSSAMVLLYPEVSGGPRPPFSGEHWFPRSIPLRFWTRESLLFGGPSLWEAPVTQGPSDDESHVSTWLGHSARIFGQTFQRLL